MSQTRKLLILVLAAILTSSAALYFATSANVLIYMNQSQELSGTVGSNSSANSKMMMPFANFTYVADDSLSDDGATAKVYELQLDGSAEEQLTKLHRKRTQEQSPRLRGQCLKLPEKVELRPNHFQVQYSAYCC